MPAQADPGHRRPGRDLAVGYHLVVPARHLNVPMRVGQIIEVPDPDTAFAMNRQPTRHGPRSSSRLAERWLSTPLSNAHLPILYARAKLTKAGDPAVARPSIAQANLDLPHGCLARAHVTAETMHEAIDLRHDRLRERLERMPRTGRPDQVVFPSADEHESRHGGEPTPRPERAAVCTSSSQAEVLNVVRERV
jgi:hypothetical protein